MTPKKKPPTRKKKRYALRNRVGMPAAMKLDIFARIVGEFFNSVPYLVGGATRGRDFTDVDVRVFLEDKEYKKLGYGDPARGSQIPKWRSVCLAFSALGKEMTGMTIDFQVQQRTYANEMYPEPRLALIGDLMVAK